MVAAVGGQDGEKKVAGGGLKKTAEDLGARSDRKARRDFRRDGCASVARTEGAGGRGRC